MENAIQDTPKASRFGQKGKIVAGIFGVVLLLSLVAAVVVYSNSTVEGTVTEALTNNNLTLAVSAMPGETVLHNISIDNAASVPLPVQLNWTEDQNANGVEYVTNMPLTQVLQPGANLVQVSFGFTNSTPVGTFNGTISHSRI